MSNMNNEHEKITSIPEKEQKRNYYGKAEYTAFAEAAHNLVEVMCYSSTQKKPLLNFVKRCAN